MRAEIAAAITDTKHNDSSIRLTFQEVAEHVGIAWGETAFDDAISLITDAVLARLREPTEEMVRKGRFALEHGASFTPEQGISRCWAAMIDEAAR
jgi:hypothetical protein